MGIAASTPIQRSQTNRRLGATLIGLTLLTLLASGCVAYQGATVLNMTDTKHEVTIHFINATSDRIEFERTLLVEPKTEVMVWKDPPLLDFQVTVLVDNGTSAKYDFPAEEVGQYRLVIELWDSGIYWGRDAID